MKRNILLIASLILLLAGCKKPGCIEGGGGIVKQERSLPPFSELSLSDNIDLTLVYDSDTNRIEVTAPQNILPNVQTYVSDGELHITNETGCRWLRSTDEKPSVRLHFQNIDTFHYNGSGNVLSENTIRQAAFAVLSDSGAGNVNLKVDVGNLGIVLLKENASISAEGQVERFYGYNNARGTLDISQLTAKRMNIIYSGLADAYVHVLDELEITIRYKGNVYCRGNPVVKKEEYFSSGKLIMLP